MTQEEKIQAEKFINMLDKGTIGIVANDFYRYKETLKTSDPDIYKKLKHVLKEAWNELRVFAKDILGITIRTAERGLFNLGKFLMGD